MQTSVMNILTVRQIVNQQNCIPYRLELSNQVGWKTRQRAIATTQPIKSRGGHWSPECGYQDLVTNFMQLTGMQ
jgi:hypothetical protein